MKKHKAYVEKNEWGFWVGCLEYPCGTRARVTNAQLWRDKALEIAERMATSLDKITEEEGKPA